MSTNITDDWVFTLTNKTVNWVTLTAAWSATKSLKENWLYVEDVWGVTEYWMVQYSNNITTVWVWWTVPLDTIVYDTGAFITLASNQFTLDEWTYIVSGAYYTYDSDNDSGYIYNISDSVTEYYWNPCRGRANPIH